MANQRSPVASYADLIRDAYKRVYSDLSNPIFRDILLNSEPFHFLSAQSPVFSPGKTEPDNLLTYVDDEANTVHRVTLDQIKHKTPYDSRIKEDTIPTKGMDWIEEQIEKIRNRKDLRPIIYTGPKGSGKTSSLNLSIYEHNQMFGTTNFLCIRGNAEEYHKIRGEIEFHIDLDQYFKCCMTSVIVSHKNKSPFKEILEDFSDTKLDKYDPKDLSQALARKARQNPELTVRDLVESISNRIVELKNDGRAHKDTMLTFELLKKVEGIARAGATPRLQKDWVVFIELFNEYCQAHAINILFIFDGLDNVWSLDEREEAAYEQTIADINTLLYPYYEVNQLDEERKKNLRIFYLIACRSESFQRIIKTANQSLDPHEAVWAFNRTEPTSEEVDTVLSAKFLRAKRRLKELQVSVNPPNSEDAKNMLKVLSTNRFVESIDELSRRTGVPPTQIFSHNTRGVLYNYMGHALFLTYFYRHRSRMPQEISEYHIFIRNLFFGGRRVVRTDEILSRNQQKYGVFFPNIFNNGYIDKDTDTRSNINHILCGFRILDLLEGGAQCRNDIYEQLMRDYNYDESNIRAHLHMLLQFRLIEHINEEAGMLINIDKFTCLPSAKVLKYIVSNHVDILVYLAFDSVLDKKYSSRIFSGIKFDEHEQNYVKSTITVAIRFLAYLNYVSGKEGGRANYLSIEPYIERMSYLLSTLEQDEDKQDVESFIQELQF